MPFREGYRLVGKAVRAAIEKHPEFERRGRTMEVNLGKKTERFDSPRLGESFGADRESGTIHDSR